MQTPLCQFWRGYLGSLATGRGLFIQRPRITAYFRIGSLIACSCQQCPHTTTRNAFLKRLGDIDCKAQESKPEVVISKLSFYSENGGAGRYVHDYSSIFGGAENNNVSKQTFLAMGFKNWN